MLALIALMMGMISISIIVLRPQNTFLMILKRINAKYALSTLPLLAIGSIFIFAIACKNMGKSNRNEMNYLSAKMAMMIKADIKRENHFRKWVFDLFEINPNQAFACLDGASISEGGIAPMPAVVREIISCFEGGIHAIAMQKYPSSGKDPMRAADMVITLRGKRAFYQIHITSPFIYANIDPADIPDFNMGENGGCTMQIAPGLQFTRQSRTG